MYKVTIGGFKTKKQAKAFLEWYEGSGEQDFYNALDWANNSGDIDNCFIDVSRKGNKGRYFDELKDGYYAEVK